MNNPIYMYHQIPWIAANFYAYPNEINYPLNNLSNNFSSNGCISSTEILQQPNNPTQFNYIVNIPISTAKSMEGKYFSGTANDIKFGEATNGWARLYNPADSGVNLYVNVWTVSDMFSSPYRAQIWYNSTPPGIIQESSFITPSNTTVKPMPQAKAMIQFGVGAKGLPSGGVLAFSRSGVTGSTIFEELQGRLIFPPGGSFTVFLSNRENPTLPASGTVAFGWWEEPI